MGNGLNFVHENGTVHEVSRLTIDIPAENRGLIPQIKAILSEEGITDIFVECMNCRNKIEACVCPLDEETAITLENI